MRYIGLDLAWSPRNLTGAAVLDGDAHAATLIDAALLTDDASIVAYVRAHAGEGPAIVAVDAPLWVPNETGRRIGEAELGKVFARYQAGAHPANRQRLTFDGVVRGEALVETLAEYGFMHAPSIAAGASVRQVIEVFPHPAMVVLFGLARTLKYKVKPGRTRDDVLAAWAAYQRHLRDLAHAEPALHGTETLLAEDVGALRGTALKRYEDRIDALMCAYIALYGHRWGDARTTVFGTMEGGYIYTPIWPQSHQE